MGNKLCAPIWKKGHRDVNSPWSTQKDAELCRLWCQVLQMVAHEEREWRGWTDGQSEITVRLVRDGQETDYQLTAFNNQSEPILEIHIIQPGTQVNHSSESFIHWTDVDNKAVEWGLKFKSVSDARQFRDCVSRAVPRIERRRSWASLSLSKRWRKSKSNQNSPRGTRRSKSQPERFDTDDMEYYGVQHSKSQSLAESVATMPRFRNRQRQDARDVFNVPHRKKGDVGTGSLRQANNRDRQYNDISFLTQSSLQQDTLRSIHDDEGFSNHSRQTRSSSRVTNQSVDSDTTLTPPLKSSDADDWPTPPTPVTPTTPTIPDVSASFDAATLKKMLETYPRTRGEDTPRSFSSTPSKIPPHRSQSLNIDHEVKDNSIHRNANMNGTQRSPNRLLMDYEIQLRNQCSRESNYPDSGFGGTISETAGSVRSGGSRTSSHKSQKSSTLPIGVGYGAPSTTGSSSSGGTKTGSYGISNLYPDSNDGQSQNFFPSEMSVDSDAESDSSIHTSYTESQFHSRHTGATRKAGWLVVKNWLMHRKRKVELASKRSWKKYWVCIKGATLFFYSVDEQNSVADIDEEAPRHMLVIEGGVSQAVPEHPKRENIFALSTAFGDAYLFEAPSQIELENWICAIHSACASLFARNHGKVNTLRLLKNEISKLDNSIDVDIKMKKMADLQLSVVTDVRSKSAISQQIAQWEENVEKLYIEQYRLRCYMSSLQGSELPNPKTLLTNVSKGTKNALGRLGVFTVTSFHALVCARTPMTMVNLSTKSKKGIISTIRDNASKIRSKTPTRAFDSPQNFQIIEIDDNAVMQFSEDHHDVTLSQQKQNTAKVVLPNSQTVVLNVQEKTTVQDLLELVCNKRQLMPNDNFLQFTNKTKDIVVPDKTAFIQKQVYEKIEILPKIIFQVELKKRGQNDDYGLAIEAELAEDSERDDELCIFVSDVISGLEADKRGLIVGDEILVINSKIISDLDMVFVESILQSCDFICMTIRSCRKEQPRLASTLKHVEVHIDNMMCPPPPSQSRIKDEVIDNLIVPAPSWVQENQTKGLSAGSKWSHLSTEQINLLLQGADQVTLFCRQTNEREFVERSHMDVEQNEHRPMSEADRLRKVIMELLDTERVYIKDLNCLIDRYLEPLKEETFLSNDEIEHLFGNIQEIVQFQMQFFHNIEEAVEMEQDFVRYTEVKHFKRILFAISGSFLDYANHFKLYSSFCASHAKAQMVLTNCDNAALRDFLKARNPKQQHSATLQSYLIKPIQRILKYPLLLNQLKYLTYPKTDENYHLNEALKNMESVACHINEMQKIYEEYGGVFESLTKQYKESSPNRAHIDLNVGDMMMYGELEWVNAQGTVGKPRKGWVFITTCFVFKAGIIILCKEIFKQKKRYQRQSMSIGRQSVISDNQDVTAYASVIPVGELQARTSSVPDARTQLMWELVHMKSEKAGRPEKVYRLINSTMELKTDFLKNIRIIIRDNIRRMNLAQNSDASPGSSFHFMSPSRSQNRNRGQRMQQYIERHSMNLEDSYQVPGDSRINDFRSRSQTVSDDAAYDELDSLQRYNSQSRTSIDSRSSTGSAKLLHSSHNPLDFSANSQNHSNIGELGSPVWKPRSYTNEHTSFPSPYYDSPGLSNSQILLTPPNAYTTGPDDDTEC